MDFNLDDLMNNNDLTNNNLSIDGMEGWTDNHDGGTDPSTFGFEGGGETAYGSSTTYGFDGGGETAYGSSTTFSFEGGETAYGSSTTYSFEDSGSDDGAGSIESDGSVTYSDLDN